MVDYISRQAALAWCKKDDWGTPDERWRPESEYGGYIEALPTVDAVEIIRCKNCRHYGWTENRIPSEREWWCYKWDDAREETDFCSHAERREE